MLKNTLTSLFIVAQAGMAGAQDAGTQQERRAATEEEVAQCSTDNFSRLVILDVDNSRTDGFVFMDCRSKEVSHKTCGDIRGLLELSMLFRSLQGGKLSAVQQMLEDSTKEQLGPAYLAHCVDTLS